MAQGLREVAGLPDPVGEVVRGGTLANGLELRQVRVPFGVVGIIYEARPNVTADAAGICLKSGNAVLLRGSASALASNTAIVGVLRDAIAGAGLDPDVVQLVPGEGHDSVKELMRARGLVDVLIPRGGAGLIRCVVEESTVPVIETGVGNCHVYVDAAADLDMAAARSCSTPRPTAPASATPPSRCSCTRTWPTTFLPAHRRARSRSAGVTDPRRRGVRGVRRGGAGHRGGLGAPSTSPWRSPPPSYPPSTPRSSTSAPTRSRHTDAIVTEDQSAARRFVAEVDSAAVLVNASTRFTDGGEFGFGAEIGISTQKLHARGPMGLPEMTVTKYVVTGDGHIR